MFVPVRVVPVTTANPHQAAHRQIYEHKARLGLAPVPKLTRHRIDLLHERSVRLHRGLPGPETDVLGCCMPCAPIQKRRTKPICDGKR